jgi:transposase InsO family protein
LEVFVELAVFVVQAVLSERRSVRDVAKEHGVSKTWLYESLARYRKGGEQALVPKSRRPHHSPSQLSPAVENEIVELRKQLLEIIGEAGPETIHYHLTKAHRRRPPCSVSTVYRVLKRRGFITPEPHKRPKSSFVSFEASLPNQCWQMDMTHVTLKNGRKTEVLNILDDYSRLCIASVVFKVTTSADVVATFYEAAAHYGLPASVLSDNGAIFTASFRGDRGALSTELARLGIVFRHSRPYHPQTCGKVERFHQTMKKYLVVNDKARSSAELQADLDLFSSYYNEIRPHRAKNRKTPMSAFRARSKARPKGHPVRDAGEFRIRHDRIDDTGKVSLRYGGKLRHLGIGRKHAGTKVMLLIDDRDVRVLTSEGELLATHHVDPARIYQPGRT